MATQALRSSAATPPAWLLAVLVLTTNIYFYVQIYDDGNAGTSRGWIMLPVDSTASSRPRAAQAQSSSTAQGCIGGLTSTAGATPPSEFDITYSTLIRFFFKRMQDNGLHMSNINAVFAAYTHSPHSPDCSVIYLWDANGVLRGEAVSFSFTSSSSTLVLELCDVLDFLRQNDIKIVFRLTRDVW